MEIFEANLDGTGLKRLTNSPGYHAEGRYSPDGKQIVFCSNRGGPKNLELYIMNADGNNVRQLTHAPDCYNGGPFFSPDGKQRHLPQRPQEEGPSAALRHQRRRHRRTGPDRRPQLGPLGPVLVQGRQAHHLHRRRPQRPADAAQLRSVLDEYRDRARSTRITFAPGADVLPVFSPDGKQGDVDLNARRPAAGAAVYLPILPRRWIDAFGAGAFRWGK